MNKRIGGILSEPLYCVSTLLDARYKDRYFDGDEKRGLHEMLHTQLDKIETDTVDELISPVSCSNEAS